MAAIQLYFMDIYRQVYWDMVQFFRYKLIVISTMLTSVSMVLAFGFGTSKVPGFSSDSSSYFEYTFPGIVAVGIMFSCTYTIGYSFIVDHNRHSIEDIVLSPLSYIGFVLGRLIGMMLKCSLQFVTVLILAILMFGIQVQIPSLLIIGFVEACMFFGGVGIVVATYTNEVSFASLVNLFLIPITYISGVFFPIGNFGIAEQIISYLPLSLHVSVFRCAITGSCSTNFVNYGAIAWAYALVMIMVALYVFKRRVARD